VRVPTVDSLEIERRPGIGLLLLAVVIAAGIPGMQPAAARQVDFPVKTISTATPPGTRFRDCRDCPAMVVIPSGRFWMGSPATEYLRYDNEGPQHLVTIAYPFAVSAYPVTLGEYRTFAQETGHGDDDGCKSGWRSDAHFDWKDVGFPQSERDPVLCVTWKDANAYIDWLNQKFRQSHRDELGSRVGPYRLLTEAEYEYAARAGSQTAFYWGQKASHAYANYDSARIGRDRWLFTSPVGSFPPNAFGLYDMTGNAWTYTQDCWNDSYVGAPSDGSAWTTGDCSQHPIRGGGWADPPHYLRIADRWAGGISSDSHAPQVGFRVARTLYQRP
jgi:formylglycine-generating enzyme required for sulfatase activity